ncbi:MAG: threonine/serine exporter family protein [Muribaculaceae bacterium]|nr:threonine/serine exporter family protein [Muribaculaceae bacterium]
MTKSTTDNSDGTLLTFLADYATALLACGATCIRIEKNVSRIAARYGVTTELTVMPSHVEICRLDGGDGWRQVAVRRIGSGGISFARNAALSRLSWDIADGKCSLAQGQQRFSKILATPPTDPMEVLLLSSVANASFCRLFGGDWIAMVIVFVATLAGMRLKQIMLESKIDLRVTVLCAAFFSTAISAAGNVFGLGSTPETALAAGVLYLIPGVPYINVVSDIIDRHYLCAFSRFMDACVLTICLSVGLTLGILVLGLKWI